MQVELYTPYWHSAVLRLTGEVFGERYFANPGQLVSKPDSVMLVGVEDNEEVVGFAQGQLLPKGGLRDHLEQRIGDLPQEIDQADAEGALGVIEVIAVAPAHRRKGIAQRLLEILHDKLIGLGADKLIITFKRGPSASDVDGLMARLGFAPWTRLPTYWKDRCESGEFKCVDWDGSCKCEASLYHKTVL